MQVTDWTGMAQGLGWLNITTSLLMLCMAVGVLAVRPGAVVNRLLAYMLLMLGLGSAAHGIPLLWPDSAAAHAAQALFLGYIFPVVGLVYVAFAAHAVPRPGAALLRTRTAHWALVAIVPLMWLFVGLIDAEREGLALAWEILTLSAAVFALINAIRHRRATTGARRRKATTYLVAFGIHDAAFILGLALHLVGRLRYGLDAGGADRLHPLVTLADGIIGLAMLGVVLVLAWGLFRSQILDFDFRIHLGISRGAIAAVFIGMFFVVSELTAELLSERVGPILGILATGLLVFALAPLQRFGDRIGQAVVPDPRPVKDFTPQEHEQMLRDQYELALEDGVLTVNELRMLDSIRDRLGIAPAVAARIQNESMAALR